MIKIFSSILLDATTIARYIVKHHVREILFTFLSSSTILFLLILLHFKLLGFDVLPLLMDPAAPIRSAQIAAAALLAIFLRIVVSKSLEDKTHLSSFRRFLKATSAQNKFRRKTKKQIAKLQDTQKQLQADSQVSAQDLEKRTQQIRDSNESYIALSRSLRELISSFKAYRRETGERAVNLAEISITKSINQASLFIFAIFFLVTTVRLYPRLHDYLHDKDVPLFETKYCAGIGTDYWGTLILPRCLVLTLRPGGDGSLRDAGIINKFVDYGYLGQHHFGLYSGDMSVLKLRKAGVEAISVSSEALALDDGGHKEEIANYNRHKML